MNTLSKIASIFRGGGSQPQERAEPVMGEISGDFDSEERSSLNGGNPNTWKIVFSDNENGSTAQVVSFDDSQIKISKDLAMTLSVVYSCMDRISSAIACMPIYIAREIEGEEIPEPGHPASAFLSHTPNDWQTPFTLKRQLMVDALNGNGYIWIRRNINTNKFHSLQYCDERSTDLINGGGGNWYYGHTDEDGVYHVIQPYNMIHIRDLGNRARKGLSRIKLHASSIGMGLEMQKYGTSFFGAGAKPSAIIGVKEKLDPKQWDMAKDNWNKAARQAAGSTNKVIFMPNELTYNSISVSPIDAQLIQAMKLTKDDICGIFNVPAWMVGNTENTSYSNITAMATGFVKNTLLPWIVNLEEEFNKKIFFTDELEQGYTVKFDFQSLLKGTPQELLKWFGEASKYGFVTRNEGRMGIGYERDTTDPTMDKFTVNVSQSKLTDEDGNEENSDDKPSGDEKE